MHKSTKNIVNYKISKFYGWSTLHKISLNSTTFYLLQWIFHLFFGPRFIHLVENSFIIFEIQFIVIESLFNFQLKIHSASIVVQKSN